MSIQFGRWLQSEHGRKIAITGWGILTAHLFYSVPLPGQTVLKRVVMNGARQSDKPLVVETTYEVL